MQIHSTLRRGALGALFLLAACGAPRIKMVRFEARTDAREELPCMIVVDDRWPENPSDARFTFTNNGAVEVDFTGRENAMVELVPVELDDEGNPIRLPRDARETSWQGVENPRSIEFSDHQPHLFFFFPRTTL
jgi:hypothetical protein